MKSEMEKILAADPETLIALYRTSDGLIHTVITGDWQSPHEVLGVICVFQNQIISELAEVDAKAPGVN